MRDVIGLLEAYGDHAEATVHPVELDEIVRPLDLDEVIERRLPPLRTRPRWVVAFVAAVVVVALIGGIALLVQSPAGEGPPVVTQQPAPTTTISTTTSTTTAPPTTTPTTVPETLPAGPISTPAYAEVASFTGTVHFYEHDPALGSAGWKATIEISHAGPLKYEATMSTGGEPYLGAAGSSYLGDGTVVRIVQPDGTMGEVLGAVDNMRSLYYDSEWPSPPWDEICAEGAVSLGSEQLLGRTTSHVACSTSSETYELWIDEAAGLVLKMAGPLMIGDYHPTAAPDGGFEFTELVLEPVTIFEPPAVPTGQTGEFPPFHMIRTEWPGVREYWYGEVDMLRETFIDADDEGWIGTFTVVSNGRLAGCSTHPDDPGGCYDVPLEDASDIYPIGRPYDQLPLPLVKESCTEQSEELVAERPTHHFVCDGVEFPRSAGSWFATPNRWAFSEYWFDTATELLMKEVAGEQDLVVKEVTSLEVNPVFPVGIFEYEE